MEVKTMTNYCKWDLSEAIYGNMDAICNEIHTMIAGTTGSGKSTLTSALMYLLTGYDPSYQRIVIFDLKRVEMARWEEFPHIDNIVTEPEDVIPALDHLIDVMEMRYKDMRRRRLRQSDHHYIHVIIDELAQVLRVKGAVDRIDQLLRLARAANIHLIMATQQPSRSAIPATIWADVTCTVGLRCKTAIESRQVIGVKGCELLPRYGKAYVQSADGLFLIDIPFVTDEEIEDQLEMWTGKRWSYA